MTAVRCPDCGAQILGYCLLCRIEAVPGDDRHELTTFDRLAAAHPDRVGRSGYWADLDGYVINVVDCTAASWCWSVGAVTSGQFISGGVATTVDAAWRAGCDAIDEQQALNAQLAELTDAEARS